MGFGTLGLFAVSVIDSSIIPLPVPGSTDLLLILLVAHRGSPVFAAVAATVGSILGGYLTWATGAKGGEAALHRYLPRRFGKRLSEWVEKSGTVAVTAVRVASSAFSADAVVACRRRFRGFAEEVSDFLQPGEDVSLCAGSLACRYLRPGGGSRFSPIPGRLEHHHHVDLFGLGGGWYPVRPVEVSPPAATARHAPRALPSARNNARGLSVMKVSLEAHGLTCKLRATSGCSQSLRENSFCEGYGLQPVHLTTQSMTLI